MQTKYQRWYDALIEQAKKRGGLGCYKERHHILPRALGGGDEPSNLVDLTYREHFLAHWLLVKIYDGEARLAMVFALHCMTLSVRGRLICGWQVEVAKRALKDLTIERQYRFQAAWKEKRRQYVAKVRAGAAAALQEGPQLSLARSGDRERVAELARAWVKASPNSLGRGRRPWAGPGRLRRRQTANP